MAMIGDNEGIKKDCAERIRNAARSLRASASAFKQQIAALKYSDSQLTSVFSSEKAKYISDRDDIIEVCDYILENVSEPMGN